MKKSIFLNSLRLLFSAREKVINSFKSRLFQIKKLDKTPTCQPEAEPTPEIATEPQPEVATEPTPRPAKEATPTKHKKSKLKLHQEFMNKIIAVEKDINDKIFVNYFNYHNPLLLVKNLISAKEDKNEKIVSNVNDGLIDLRNDIYRKKIAENENLKKEVDIVEKNFDFTKEQKGKGNKILNLKEMLQRLPIVLAQEKAGNTSENLLNEIRQIIYSLYRETEFTKKVQHNIMTSTKI